MSKDKNNNEIQVGNRVTLTAEILALSSDELYAEIRLENGNIHFIRTEHLLRVSPETSESGFDVKPEFLPK